MKLSYRDRVILIVAIIIAIIAIGIFAFIKPKATEISSNKTTLTNVEKTWSDMKAEIDQIPVLQTNIKKLHSEAKGWAKSFEPEKTAVEMDEALQELLNKNKMEISEGAALAVADPTVETLPFYYYSPNVLTYSLFEGADLDGSIAKNLSEELKESTVLGSRSAQEVVCATAQFTCTTTKEDLLNFLKDVKALDSTILVTNVTIPDYTFYPELDPAVAGMTPEEQAKEQEMLDHADVSIQVKFYSVQVPTDPYLGEEAAK